MKEMSTIDEHQDDLLHIQQPLQSQSIINVNQSSDSKLEPDPVVADQLNGSNELASISTDQINNQATSSSDIELQVPVTSISISEPVNTQLATAQHASQPSVHHSVDAQTALSSVPEPLRYPAHRIRSLPEPFSTAYQQPLVSFESNTESNGSSPVTMKSTKPHRTVLYDPAENNKLTAQALAGQDDNEEKRSVTACTFL
jgi:hypothetical protein